MNKFTVSAKGFLGMLVAIFFSMQAMAQCSASFATIYTPGDPAIEFQSAAVNTNSPTAVYFWSYGDGSTSFGPLATHTYANSGAFMVCLTVSDSLNNCQMSNCDSVFANQNSGCQPYYDAVEFMPNEVSLDVYNPVASASYTWTIGGQVLNGSQAIVTLASGTYMACLHVEDSINNCVFDDCITVIVNGSTSCDATFSNYTDPSGTLFSPFYTAANVAYFWDFGDGATSNQVSPSHVYANSGSYNVCLTVIDSINNCVANFCDSVWTNSISLCDASFANYQTSNNDFSFAANNASAGIMYIWSFGDGSNGFGPNVAHTFAGAGIYSVCLTVVDSFLNCNDQFCSDIQVGFVSPSCNANFTAFDDSTGFTILTPDYFSNSTYYVWTIDGVVMQNVWNQAFIPTDSLSHQVCLSVIDTLAGCVIDSCQTLAPRYATSNNTANIMSLVAYPNPIQGDILNLEFSAIGSGSANIRIMNQVGQVLIENNTQIASGSQTLSLDVSSLSSGLYIAQIQLNGKSQSIRISK